MRLRRPLLLPLALPSPGCTLTVRARPLPSPRRPCSLTSSNYDDDEKKLTGGRNGYGAKLTNIYSHEFSASSPSCSSRAASSTNH